MHTHIYAKLSFALSLYYSAVPVCDSLLSLLFIFHLLFSVYEWELVCSQYFLATSYTLLSIQCFTCKKQWKLSERQRNECKLFSDPSAFLSSSQLWVVWFLHLFIYATRIKVCTGAELFPHRSSYSGVNSAWLINLETGPQFSVSTFKIVILNQISFSNSALKKVAL